MKTKELENEELQIELDRLKNIIIKQHGQNFDKLAMFSFGYLYQIILNWNNPVWRNLVTAKELLEPLEKEFKKYQ